MIELPTPGCRLGFTYQQLKEIFPNEDEFYRFGDWMRGQTGAICEGKRYDHDLKVELVACAGVAHGMIVYPWDVRAFINGDPVID